MSSPRKSIRCCNGCRDRDEVRCRNGQCDHPRGQTPVSISSSIGSTIRLGGMIVIATGILIAIKYFG
jgi:hypothetical protein